MSEIHSPPAVTELISLRSHATKGAASFKKHAHSFLEFSLVTDDSCTILYPPGERKTKPNTLLHYRQGEVHGAICSPGRKTRFWVVHFNAEAKLYSRLGSLTAPQPSDRVWVLTKEQIETFQWIFMQMLNERSTKRPFGRVAASAWLQLLLINVQRWAERKEGHIMPAPARANPEVLRLWQMVNEAVGMPNDQLGFLFSAPNYDSTRHAFKKTFGCSPREMLLRLRMEHAQNLLLDSALSIKEIAVRVGYSRQHEFNRMFNNYAGMAPSRWRADPTAR